MRERKRGHKSERLLEVRDENESRRKLILCNTKEVLGFEIIHFANSESEK